MKRFITFILIAALVLTLGSAAFASGEERASQRGALARNEASSGDPASADPAAGDQG